eukprot:Polyplicarium_translucidae@DN2920_c2_g1_i1.p1
MTEDPKLLDEERIIEIAQASEMSFQRIFCGAWEEFLTDLRKCVIQQRDEKAHDGVSVAASLKAASGSIGFFIRCYQHLEIPEVRRTCLLICGLGMWSNISVRQRSVLLEVEQVSMAKLWHAAERRLAKRRRQVAEIAEPVLSASGATEEQLKGICTDMSAAAINEFLDRFLFLVEVGFESVVRQRGSPGKDAQKSAPQRIAELDDEDISGMPDAEESVPAQEAAPADAPPSACLEICEVLLCERALEFLIDLLSQLPTRRVLLPLLLSKQFAVRCLLSYVATDPEANLFRQLLDILVFYERFEINDETGEPLSSGELTERHYRAMHRFQVICFKQSQLCAAREAEDPPADEIDSAEKPSEMLKRVALGAIADLDTPSALRSLLDKLPDDVLVSVAQGATIIDGELEACIKTETAGSKWHPGNARELLAEIVVHRLSRRVDQLRQISDSPLFPTDDVLWDPSFVPPRDVPPDELSMALPKLNLQFLTVHDYLLRNFKLYRLESAYQIREDLEEAVWQMRPLRDTSGTRFLGSWRMAIPMFNFSIVSTKPPQLGHREPSEVRGEITIDLSRCRDFSSRREWDALRPNDVLFMLSVAPPASSTRLPTTHHQLEAGTFPVTLGVLHVRGCEVTELVDEEGNSITDVNPMERKDPVGDLRTIRCTIDTAQYQLDVDTIMKKEGFEDMYGRFNLLVRRKPAANNFKAVLQTIRKLMNETERAVVPEWLHELFLGYGDPKVSLASIPRGGRGEA